MKKSIKLFVVSCLLVSMLFGCGKQDVKNDSDLKIYVTINSMDTFRQTLVNAASEKAAERGVIFDYDDAQGSIENQVEQIKAAASQGYDAILCATVSNDTVVELKASAGDVPIIFINSCPDKKHLEEGKYVYVGSDEETAGQFQAEYVLDKFASKDELNVVLIEGSKGHSATIGRTTGVKSTFNASGKKINYVFEDYADWDREKAKKLFNLFLKTGSFADCVICGNDEMALGVIEACKEAGIDLSTLPVLGVDATADGCAAIQNGEMAFTVYQSGLGQGQRAVETAIELVNGNNGNELEGMTEDGMYVWVPFEKVDSSNVSQYISK